MHVCFCFQFNDKAVKDALDEKDGSKRIHARDVHATCSGADKPNCGKCLGHIDELIQEHPVHGENHPKNRNKIIPTLNCG